MEKLSNYGINNIVAIDDIFFELSMSTKISELDETMVSNFDVIVSSIDSKNGMQGKFTDYVQENEGEYICDFFDEEEIDVTLSDKIIQSYNQMQLEYYKDLLEIPGISIQMCTPIVQDIKTQLESLDSIENRTLIIVDRKLAGKDELYGKKLLSDILSEVSDYLTNKGNFFLVMYSSDPKELHSYEETLNYLSDELELSDEIISKIALHINFLKKDVDATRETDFIKVLRKSQKANYVNTYDQIFSISMMALRERIWNLNRNESLLHYDYLVEGQQIDQIIFGMFTDKFKKGYTQFMLENFGSYINPIRNSIQKYENDRVSNESVEVDKTPAKYRFIKEVNSAIHGGKNVDPVFQSDDISFGDIITINECNYLVVSQNCDIAIRQNSKRLVESFQLIRVKEKKKPIDAKWLVEYFKNFSSNFKPNKIDLNKDGIEYFENTFHNPISKTELEVMGFERSDLKKIEETLKDNKTTTVLKNLVFEDYTGKFPEICEYERDKGFNEIYTIPCFWLDSLLIRKEDECIINEEFIEKSKEIRLATKRKIKNDYDKMIEKLSFLPKDFLIESFEKNLFNPLIDVRPEFNSDETLVGFKLQNISRESKLKNHVARAIHLEMIAKQTREAINDSIPI